MSGIEDAERVPVVIAVGEICDRPAVEIEGLDLIELMLAALREAETELGIAVLDRLWRDDLGERPHCLAS